MCIWRCWNWCSLLLLTPKSSHPPLSERNFTPFACYWDRTRPDLPFFTRNYRWHSASTWLLKCMATEGRSRTAWLCVSCQVPCPHHRNTRSARQSTQRLQWQSPDIYWLGHLPPFQLPKGSFHMPLSLSHWNLWDCRQLQHWIHGMASHWPCKGCLPLNKHEGWIPSNDGMVRSARTSNSPWQICPKMSGSGFHTQ